MRSRLSGTRPLSPRFRVEAGRPCIDIRLSSWRQLFDSRDPAPFRDRDLDDDAVDYITVSFRELGRRADAKLVLHLAEPQASSMPPEVFREAVHAYYAHEQRQAEAGLAGTLRYGRTALIIGAGFLGLCHVLARAAEDGVRPAVLGTFLKEGLTILGWVAMWRPIDILLYAWWPARELIEVYGRLARIEVAVHYEGGGGALDSPS